MHTTEDILKSKEFCILDSVRMTNLSDNHKLKGKGAAALAKILAVRFEETGTHEFAGIEECASNCVLLDIRDWYPGRADMEITRIVEVPMYFAEIQPLVPMATTRLNERLEFARDTGFLIMGPDESLAVVLKRPGESNSVLVAAFMTDEVGQPRTLSDITSWSLDYHLTQRHIASLHQTSVKEAIGSTNLDCLYELGRDNSSPHRVALLKNTLALLRQHEDIAQPERTSSGAVIRRWHCSEGSTATIAKLTPPAEGWIRYPTSQDDWYFCEVINPIKRETMCYCEGDVSHVICDDARQFEDELKRKAEFYGINRPSAARGYDLDGSVTHYFDNLFFLSGKLGIVQFANDEMVEVGSVPQAPLFGALMLDHPLIQAMSGQPEVEFQVPADAFELDILSPLAFQAYTCHALIHSDGIDIQVTFGSGKVACGMLGAKDLEPA
jgi:hypothetical protein